jgi:hypothetical protein
MSLAEELGQKDEELDRDEALLGIELVEPSGKSFGCKLSGSMPYGTGGPVEQWDPKPAATAVRTMAAALAARRPSRFH